MPLLWLSLAFLSGILLGSALHLSAAAWLCAAGVSLALAILLRRLAPGRGWRGALARLAHGPVGMRAAPLALLALACLGAARLVADHPPPAPGRLSYYAGQGPAAVTGVVAAPPERRDGGVLLQIEVSQVTLLADGVEPAPRAVRGTLQARVPPGAGYRYGDRLRLEGRLTPVQPDSGSVFTRALARRGVEAALTAARVVRLETGRGSPPLAALYAFRERALAVLDRLFPPPESALLAGILLGEESEIPTSINEAFQVTGTAHIVAISGFNIAILAGLFVSLFSRWLGARRGATVAALAIAAYTLLVGANPPVVRAAIMGGLALLAAQIGRRGVAANTLAFTAALMCLGDPDLLWSASFQLSVMATLGLVLYAAPLQAAFTRLAASRLPAGLAQRLAGPAGEYFLFTLAAQVTTLPVMAYHFRRISWSALIANPLVLPPQPLVMVLGGLAVLAGLVWLPLGQALAWLAWPAAAYTLRAVELLARLPGVSIALGGITPAGAALFYALLFWLTLRRPSLQRLRAAVPSSAALICAAALAILAWQGALAAPRGRLRVTLLDSGAGMGLLLQTPDGNAALVGGGPAAAPLSAALGRRLPFYARHLDALLVAAPEGRHVAGLARTLERYPARFALWAGADELSAAAGPLRAALAASGAAPVDAQLGQTLLLGGEVRLSVACAGRTGAAYLLEWRDFRLLIPGGCPPAELERLARAGRLGHPPAALVLSAGQADRLGGELLAKLGPQIVLVAGQATDGDQVAFGSRRWLSTQRNGWVQLSTDGESLWVDVEKSDPQ